MSEPEVKFEVDEYGRIGYRVTNEGVLLSKDEKEFIIDSFTQLKAENAKLRELVLCLLTCASDNGDACDKCPVNGGSGIWEFEDFCDSLLDRVHELGVEVDG